MLRRALLLTPFLFAGCASPRTNPVIAGDAASVSGTAAPSTAAPSVEEPAAPDAATGDFTDFAPQSRVPPGPPPPRHRERFTLKSGYYGSNEDELDDGFIIIASYMRPTSPTFAAETEIGYLDASGTDDGVERDVWSIPLLVNGRLNLPVGERTELYGGLGLGTFYYDVEAKRPGVKVSGEGFLIGGDAYFGGDVQLGESLYLGLEGKYYLTDSASDLDGSLDAYVVLLTLGFGR